MMTSSRLASLMLPPGCCFFASLPLQFTLADLHFCFRLLLQSARMDATWTQLKDVTASRTFRFHLNLPEKGIPTFHNGATPFVPLSYITNQIVAIQWCCVSVFNVRTNPTNLDSMGQRRMEWVASSMGSFPTQRCDQDIVWWRGRFLHSVAHRRWDLGPDGNRAAAVVHEAD